MSWLDKSKRCSFKDYDDFRKELSALQNTKSRSERMLIEKINFEEKWLGYCFGCSRIIPKTKIYCPWCADE